MILRGSEATPPFYRTEHALTILRSSLQTASHDSQSYLILSDLERANPPRQLPRELNRESQFTMTPTNPTYHSPTRSASQPMAGTKRTWEGNSVPRSDSGLQQPASAAALSNTGAPTPTKTTTMTSQDQGQGQGQLDEPQSQVLSVFTNFRNELDEHHDRRERVIKTSRDITALSKKMSVYRQLIENMMLDG